LAASLRQDYPKIRRAGAEVAVIKPDTVEEHRKYSAALFGVELPYLFVPDPNLDIARRYSLLRNEEHPHGGFYYRTFWIVNREGIITYKSVPWKVDNGATFGNEEYQQIFALIGSEPGNWIATCGLKTP